MAFEPFIHFVQGLQHKLSISKNGERNVQSFQQAAFLRQIQRDIEQNNVMNMPLEQLKVIVFDIETTGFFPHQGDEIISIGAIKVSGKEIIENDVFYSLVNYERELSCEISELTGITSEELVSAPPLSSVLRQFYEFVKGEPLVAHHANHEKSFMQSANWKLFKSPFKHRIVDTSFLYKIAEPTMNLTKLEDLCEYNSIEIHNRHHALGDAKLTAKLWVNYVEKLQKLGCHTLRDIYDTYARL